MVREIGYRSSYHRLEHLESLVAFFCFLSKQIPKQKNRTAYKPTSCLRLKIMFDS